MADQEYKGAIVLGGHVQALGIVRALGRVGVPVYLLDQTKAGVARWSRYCRGEKLVSEWTAASVVAALEEMAGDYGPCVVFPTDDMAVSILSQNCERLGALHALVTPPWNVTEKAYNKICTYREARSCGVPVPNTCFPESLEDLQASTRDWTFPMILKPAVMYTFARVTRKKVILVPKHSDLPAAYQEMTAVIPASEVMAQDIVPGGSQHLYSFGVLADQGRVVAGFTARRKRQFPMDFGRASTFVETCDIAELAEYGSRLLRHIQYSGLAEVEFKYDSRDGQYKLLEINPRLWKWHSIVEGLGINLVLMQFRMANGETLEGPGVLPFQECKWTDRISDVYVCLKEISQGRLKVGEWLQSYRGTCVDSVFSWADPLPGLAITVLSPYMALTR